jgi:hypothetical protein
MQRVIGWILAGDADLAGIGTAVVAPVVDVTVLTPPRPGSACGGW